MPALVALAAAVAVVLVAATAIWSLRRRLMVVTVRGSSMLPSYRDGERLLVRRRPPAEGLRTGQVVVATPPGAPHAAGPHASAPVLVVRSAAGQAHEVRARGGNRQQVVKRIAALPGDPLPPDITPGAERSDPALSDRVPPGRLVLLGDNAAESVDSRHYGDRKSVV